MTCRVGSFFVFFLPFTAQVGQSILSLPSSLSTVFPFYPAIAIDLKEGRVLHTMKKRKRQQRDRQVESAFERRGNKMQMMQIDGAMPWVPSTAFYLAPYFSLFLLLSHSIFSLLFLHCTHFVCMCRQPGRTEEVESWAGNYVCVYCQASSSHINFCHQRIKGLPARKTQKTGKRAAVSFLSLSSSRLFLSVLSFFIFSFLRSFFISPFFSWIWRRCDEQAPFIELLTKHVARLILFQGLGSFFIELAAVQPFLLLPHPLPKRSCSNLLSPTHKTLALSRAKKYVDQLASHYARQCTGSVWPDLSSVSFSLIILFSVHSCRPSCWCQEKAETARLA